MERVILHCDMNNYFASVEEKFNSKLKKIPFAVCGDPKMRHSIVMSKNELAKSAGVLTGISYHQAKEICPDLGYVEADYSKYLAETKFARQIYKKYTDTIITKENYKEIVWSLPASDLLFVGQQRKKQLSKIGIDTIGDIATANPKTLRKLLGKVGDDLYRFANGDDQSFKPDNDMIGSIGNTITPPEDLYCLEDAAALLYLISSSICTRLKNHNLKACCVSVTTKDSDFNTLTRQCSMALPTDNINAIFNRAISLFQKHYNFANPLRAIGIRVDNLVILEYEQLSLFEAEDIKICVNIDERIKKLTLKFGELNVEKAATSKEWS